MNWEYIKQAKKDEAIPKNRVIEMRVLKSCKLDSVHAIDVDNHFGKGEQFRGHGVLTIWTKKEVTPE